MTELSRRALTRLTNLPQADKDAILQRIGGALSGGLTMEALEEVSEILRIASLPHGTRTAYNQGCRCAECTRSNSVAQREWYRKNRASTPRGL